MAQYATIARKPQPGDVVVSKGGTLYLVEEIYREGISNRIDFYAVVDLATRNRPNTFKPGEISVLSAKAAKEALAEARATDTAPTTVLVTSVTLHRDHASMRAVDEAGYAWSITLKTGPRVGSLSSARAHFASTIKSVLDATRHAYRLTSTYDEAADEWFVRAGNYSIHSRDLSFEAID
jgi:hypothetical protein